jgi:hypothetical protein
MESKKIEVFLNRKIFNDLDKSLITDFQKEQIIKILSVYDTQKIKNRLKNVHDFIKYDVDGDWLKRLEIIQKVLKNDVMSEYALEIRYGKHNVIELKKQISYKASHTKEKYVEKYGEIDGLNKWEEFKVKSKTPWGIKACIEKYGEIDGKKKWEERLAKKNATMQERKKYKPYRNGRTLGEYQNRYGIEDGYKKWFDRNKKHSYRFSKDYYIQTYGVKEGMEKWFMYCKTMNKLSLTSLIEKHGLTLGTKKYEENVNKLKYINSKKFFIDKYGVEIGEKKYQEKRINQYFNLNNKRYSKISQELFWRIFLSLDETDNIFFAEYNNEYILYPFFGELKIIELDFKYGNKIIEFDGDYWHSNPEQIYRDNLRDEYLISKGYEILRVKEGEYKKDKESIITQCLVFLNKKEQC